MGPATPTNAPAQQPLWQVEFGQIYAIPHEVEALVQKGLADDYSWHNDICPSFGIIVGTPPEEYEVRLWVEHPDQSEREMPTRFTVTKTATDGGDIEVLAETESIGEAITAYTRGIGQQGVQTTPQPQVDSETRIYDLHAKKKRFGLTPDEESEFARLLQERGKLPGYLASRRGKTWMTPFCKFSTYSTAMTMAQTDDEEPWEAEIAPLLASGLVEESEDFENGKYRILGIPEEFGEWYVQYTEDNDGRGGVMATWEVSQESADGRGTIWDETYDAMPAYEWAMRNYKNPVGQPKTHQLGHGTPPSPTIKPQDSIKQVQDAIYDATKMGAPPEAVAKLPSLFREYEQMTGKKHPLGRMAATTSAAWVRGACQLSGTRLSSWVRKSCKFSKS